MFMNANADRMDCERCDTSRPPLNPQEANFALRNQQYYWGSSGWEKPADATAGGEAAPGLPAGESVAPASVTGPDGEPSRMGPQRGPSRTRFDPSNNGAAEHKDTVGVLCLSQDTFQWLLALGVGSYQIFKLVMATLLSVFVPQRCDDVDAFGVPTGTFHDCTAKENFEDLTNFNTFVVVFNFITLLFGLIHQFTVFMRERRLIDVLDEDPTVTNDYLVRKDRKGRQVIEMYPRIGAIINSRNGWTFVTASMVLFCFFINAIVSAVLIFRDYYAGFRSVTTFLTNVFLLVQVFVNHWNLSRVGWKTGIAYSFFKSDASVYNNVDRKLKSDPTYFIPRKPQPSVGPGRPASGRRHHHHNGNPTEANNGAPAAV
jgi:hypothetical protein